MEFLFENPLLLIALIGIISSLYKRVKGDSSEEGKQNPRGPFTHTTQPIQPRPVERKKMVKPVVIQKPLEEVLLQARRSIEATPLEQPVNTRTVIKESRIRMQDESRVNKKKNHNEHSFNLNQTSLIDGLIWSEVLGPPRAKKAYMAKKHMYRGRG